MGAGGPDCDERQSPPPPKGYIEPQLQAYDRLLTLARRTQTGLKEQGFGNLDNLPKLDSFVEALEKAKRYVVKELQDTALQEKTKQTEVDSYMEPGKKCVLHGIDGESDWETIRVEILRSLGGAMPQPADGPVLTAKDRRAALLADVHTGGDSANPTRVLYEGEGVPHVIFVAVKDINGPRLTVGFTYAHYEFTEPYGGKRLTDEQWQEKFYKGTDDFDPFTYVPQASWPKVNTWYSQLFGQ
jgi:hypothetical protein